MTETRRLKALPSAKRKPLEHTCQVAARVVLAGTQDTHVQGATPIAGPGRGYITVRVGRVLTYVEDRDALDCTYSAWKKAHDLADKVFGRRPEPADRLRG